MLHSFVNARKAYAENVEPIENYHIVASPPAKQVFTACIA